MRRFCLNLLLLLPLAAPAACSAKRYFSKDPREGRRRVDADLAPELARFEALLGREVAGLPVTFDPSPKAGRSGRCETYANGEREVLIDRETWDHAAETQRTYLVFHELGHCVLDRAHEDAFMMITDMTSGAPVRYSAPKSLMYSLSGLALGGGAALQAHYLAELFGKESPLPLLPDGSRRLDARPLAAQGLQR